MTGRFDAPILLRETRSAFIRAQSDCTITPEQIRFALDSRSMLVYARDNQLFRVHLPDARWERLDTGEHTGDAVAISSDGRRVLMETYVTRASSDRWSELSVIDLDRPRQRTVVGTRPIMAPARGWQRLEDFFAPDSHLSADGRFVVMGFLKKENAKDAAVKETGHLAVVDLASGASRVCGGPPVKTLKMAPDGKSFVTLNTDSTLSVWRLGDSPDLTSTPPATRVASRSNLHRLGRNVLFYIGRPATWFCWVNNRKRLVPRRSGPSRFLTRVRFVSFAAGRWNHPVSLGTRTDSSAVSRSRRSRSRPTAARSRSRRPSRHMSASSISTVARNNTPSAATTRP